MNKFEDISKKISFAEFLVGRGSDEYAIGAMKHVISASQLLVQQITGLNEFDCKSPQVAKKALKKFKEEKLQDFSKFYVKLILKEEKAHVSKQEVEEDIRKLKKYAEWAKKQNLVDDKKSPFFKEV